jgi:hypothetical protein
VEQIAQSKPFPSLRFTLGLLRDLGPSYLLSLCTPKSSLRRAVDIGYFAQLPKPFIAEQVEFVEECLKYLGRRRNAHLNLKE